MSTPRAFWAVVVLSLALAGTTAHAASLVWNVTDGTWDTSTPNWTGGSTLFTDGGVDSVAFNNAAGGTISITANMNPLSTTVSAASGTYTFNGGPIAGSGSLSKTGGGTLAINGVGATYYSGGTTVDGGTLALTGANLGFSSVGAGTLTINAGGTVTANGHNVFGGGNLAGIPAIVINGGQLNPAQYNWMKSLEMTGGTVNAYNSAGGDGLYMAGTPTITTHASAASATIAAKITQAAAVTYTIEDGAAANDLVITGTIAGSGNLIKNGAGTLALSGGNGNFSGNVTVNAGTLYFNGGANSYPLGNVAGRTVTINPGATFTAAEGCHNPFGTNANVPTIILNGGTYNSPQYNHTQNIEMTGGIIQPTGSQVDGLDMRNAPTITIHASAGGSTIASKMSLNSGNVTFAVEDGAAATDLLVSGVMTGNAGIVKNGNGTMVLSGADSFGGTIQVNGGTLLFNGNTVSSTVAANVRSINVQGGATLSIATGANLTMAGVVGLGTAGSSAGNLLQSGGTLTVNGTEGGGANRAFAIGEYPGETSTYTMTGGVLAVNNGNMYIGWDGGGALSVTNAQVNVNGLLLLSGYNGGAGSGSLTVNNGAAVTVGTAVFIGHNSGLSGTVTQNGGALTINANDGGVQSRALTIGEYPSETSSYTLNGGTLTVNNGTTFVSYNGNGSLSIAGGTANLKQIQVTNAGGTTGTLTLTGGTLAVGSGGITAGSGTPIINLGGGTVGASATWSSSVGMTLTGTGGDTTFDTGANAITLNGTLGGAGGLIKNGSGNLTLTNRSNNYTGNTTVNGGTLTLNAGNSQSSLIGTGTLTVNAGGTVNCNVNSFGYNPPVNNIVINGGSVNQVSADSHLASIQMTGGTLGGPGAFNPHNDITVLASASTATISVATLNLTVANINVNVADGAAADDLLVSSNITGGGLGFTKTGAGTMVLSGNSSYTGVTNIADGTLVLDGGGTYGTKLAGSGTLIKRGGGTVTLQGGNGGFTGNVIVNGGTLVLNNGNDPSLGRYANRTITINPGAAITATAGGHNPFGTNSEPPLLIINGGTFNPSQYDHMQSFEMTGGTISADPGGGDGLDMKNNPTVTIHASAGGSTIASKMTVNSAVTFNVEDGATATDLLMSGQIVGGSSVTKSGNGTMALGGANTYSGGTILNAGVINVGNASAFGTGILTLNASGTVITGSAFNLNAAANTHTAGTNLVVNGTDSFANNMTILGTGGTSGLSVGGTGTLTYSGVVTPYNGAMGLKNTATLKLPTGASISLTGTVGNQIIFADPGTTLVLNGGSFSSTGNNGPSAGYIGNLTVNSGSFYAQSNETGQASRFYTLVMPNANDSIILNGGTTSVQGISTQAAGANMSTIDFNGGTLKVLAQPAGAGGGNFIPSSANLQAVVQAGGAIFDTNGNNATIAQTLIHDPALGASLDGGLTKNGAGTLTISGGNGGVNGNVTVNAGTLYFNGAANSYPLGMNGARTVTINPGATFTAAEGCHNPFGTLGNVGTLIINGGTYNSPQYNHMNNLIMTGGLIQPTGSQVDGLDMRNSPTVTIHGSATGSTIASKMSLNSPVLFNVEDGAAASDLLMTGAIVGGNSLTKAGAGTMTLSGSGGLFTYSGGTAVNGGVLELKNSGNGSGDGWRSNITLSNNAIVWLTDTSGQTGDLRANITGTGSLVKKDVGIERIGTWSGVPTLDYTGNTTVEAGTLSLQGQASGRGFNTTGNLVIDSGAAFEFSGLAAQQSANASRFGALIGAGTLQVAWGTPFIEIGNGDKSGTFSGAITGPLTLTKIGAGTETFSGNSTYTGPTTVNGGKLLIDGSITSPVTVNSGGMLGGNGHVTGAVTVNAGGTVSAGDSPGHLTITGNYVQSGTMLAELGGLQQGVTYDWIDVNGTATLAAGSIVDVNAWNNWPSPGEGVPYYVLTATGGITNNDLAGITFDFSGAPGWLGEWKASIVPWPAGGSNAEALMLEAVPEPATMVLLGLAIAGLGGYLRRRKN